MKSVLSVIVAILVGVAILGVSSKAGAGKVVFPTKEEMKAIFRIPKEEVRSMIGDPNVIILDIRLKSHWEKSKVQIPGAVYEDPVADIKTWAHKYPKDKLIVLY